MPAFREPFQANRHSLLVRRAISQLFSMFFWARGRISAGRDAFPNCSTSCLEEIKIRSWRTLRQREIGSILVEPIQGRGGDRAAAGFFDYAEADLR